MIAKLFRLLLAFLFGGAAFAGGAVAPSSIQQWVAQPLEQLLARFGAAPEKAGAGNTASASASATANTTGEPAAAGIAAAPAKTEPIPLQNLLIPSPLPDKGQYALQAGQFESMDDANALGVRIKNAKLPFDKVLDVIDQAGKRWAIVPIGPYASADEARAARLPVASVLGVNTSLPLILLPAAKPKE